MIIYFFTILLLFIFSIVETNYSVKVNTSRIMLFSIYLLLIIQVGLRWETGTDWNPYLYHFNSITDYASTSPLKNGFEYGYNLLVWVIKLVFSNYSFFLVIHAIIYYYLIIKSFQRYSSNLFLSLLMFYTLTMGMLGSNRQLIALAICIYAIRFVIEKKPFLFLLFIGLAISFHTTSFLFLIYYFLNREIKPKFLILILGGTFIIGHSQLPIILFTHIGDLIGGNTAIKTLSYLEGAKEVLSKFELSFIGLLKRLLFVLFFYYNRKKISEKLIYYNVMLNGYIVGIAFYFLFANTLLVMLSRGSLFFNVMEPLLIASQICLFKGKLNKSIALTILLVFSIFFFFQSISGYPELFLPYKGIFINADYQRFSY